MLGPYLRFGNNKVGAWFVADKISKDSLLIHAALTEVEEDAAFGRIWGYLEGQRGFLSVQYLWEGRAHRKPKNRPHLRHNFLVTF
jgi:hypothetical protein